MSETVYVNSFDPSEVAWIEIGSSPYLHNTTADYIYTDVDYQFESKFGFPITAGSGTIDAVKIKVEVQSILEGFMEIFLWNGTSWVSLGFASSPDVYTWKEFDVTSILDTWEKINGAKLRFCSFVFPKEAVYVRRATRVVTYTPVAGIASKRLLVGVGV